MSAYTVERVDGQGRPLVVRFPRWEGDNPGAALRKREPSAGAPWFLRWWRDGREFCRMVSQPHHPAPWTREGISAAIDAAREILGRDLKPGSRVCVGALVTLWAGSGHPFPNCVRRSPVEAARLVRHLGRALRHWSPWIVSEIQPPDLVTYAEQRQAPRAVDLEFAALSSACAWGVARGHIVANPFAKRPRFRRPEDVSRSPERAPQSDEDFHRILSVLLSGSPMDRAVGGHLAFQALTGLRPGEPGALLRCSLSSGAPGTIRELPSGSKVMLVRRSKRGINPAVELHPALLHFLNAWDHHLIVNMPNSVHWFPHPEIHSQPLVPFGDSAASPILGARLAKACTAAGVPHCSPHGMRAYFTRCAMSSGMDLGKISLALGQRSGAPLVALCYNAQGNIVADGSCDWMPNGVPPAWNQLTSLG